MPVPWLHHQRTRQLRPTIGTTKPVGTSCPSRRGGRTMTSMATWTMTCTATTSTPLSTSTSSGRLSSAAPAPLFGSLTCPRLGVHVGNSGKKFPQFSSASASLLLSHVNIRLLQRRTAELTCEWETCCPVAPVVSGVHMSWSFALNCKCVDFESQISTYQ